MKKLTSTLKYKFNTLPYIGATLLAAILELFRIPVSSLLNKIVVMPIFAAFEPGVWKDIAAIFVLVLFVLWMAKEHHWRFLIKVALYGLVFYGSQRINKYWSFEKMALFPHIGYWDIALLAFILPIPLYFLFPGKTDGAQQEKSTQGFTEDIEVNSYEEDRFKRKVVADRIAQLIKLTNNRKSFAIGILGKFGSGKTSFLNLINLGLDNSEVLKVCFNPWSAGSLQTIRREFFDLLATKVATVEPRISTLIYSYGRRLASFDTRSLAWLNWFGFLKNPLSAQSSGEYQQINQMLRSTGRKIVITIDDLDRLYPGEIMEVLKLIRNTANFSNIFYLVGYDKIYVTNAMQVLNEAGAADYLDKIFQLEIPLPKPEEDDLISSIETHLKSFVSATHYDVIKNRLIPEGFRNLYERSYSTILRNGRDAIRFVNSFKIIYHLIGEEVDFECLLILELIKFRFSRIYDLIYTRSDQFLYEIPVSSTHEQYFAPRMVESKGTAEKEISVFKTYIDKLEWLGPEDVVLLDTLFLTLFKGGRYYRPEQNNSISYPLYFNIYFRYRLSQTDISDRDFKAAMTSGNMSKYMTQCASLNLHKELMVRLMQEDISKDRHHFEQVITWIFTFGRTLAEKEGVLRFDYEALIDKIYNYHNLISDKLYKKDINNYKYFIKRLFDISIAPYLFENELIYHLKEKGNGFILSIDELTAYQLSFFTRYAESGHGLNEDALWIFWGARKYLRTQGKQHNSYREHWQFEPDLVKKMKSYLMRKDPKEFLKFSIKRDVREPSMASIYKQVLEMFNDPAEFRKLITENSILDEEVKKEYLDLFDKCAAQDFLKPVEMKFKSELRREK